jgi:hypothetical protein
MKIKPCPFCGEEAEVNNGGFGEKYVTCKNNQCGGSLSGSIWFTSDEEAIEVWNRRPPMDEAISILDWCRGYVSGYKHDYSESNLPKIDDFIEKQK